jgi:hypothetical protein
MMNIKTTIQANQYKGVNNSNIISADNTAGEAVLSLINNSGADMLGAQYSLDLRSILKA